MIRYVNAASQGDTDAMGKLYAKTLKSSYYLALKLCGDADEAVDITKNAYARVFCTIARLKKPDAFEIFMRQNIAAVYKEGRKFTFGDAVADVPESTLEFLSEDVYTDVRKTAAALDAVSELSPELRSTVILHYYSGMPIGPLSRYLNISESSANAVLAKAKEIIFSKCGSGEPSENPESPYPVLNRIFKREMETTAIDPSAVREIFSYVIDKYNTFKEVENSRAPVTVPASKGEFFKNISSEPSVPVNTNSAADKTPSDEEIDFDRFVDTPVEKPASSGKGFSVAGVLDFFKNFDFKKIDLKKAGIILVALIAIILIITGIAKAAGKKKDNPDVQVSTANTSDVEYQWKNTGFADCSEINYLNEYFCCFKSATTNKYGLLDYQGNILIQPHYDNPFLACGSGRDYTNSNKYHVVVDIDGVKHYVTYSGGKAEITGQEHQSHAFQVDEFPEGVKYDERDRFFEGYAAARKNGKWGYVDMDGKKVIPYKYDAVNFDTGSGSDTLNAYNCDYCRPVTGGLIAVKKNGSMGIINLEDEVIVPFEYSVIMPGLNGVFIAKKDNTWGVILTGSAITTFPGVNLIIDASPDDITTDPAGEDKYYIVTGSGGINVRADADANAEKVGELPSGERVKGCGTKLSSTGKEWLRIEYNNTYAYISMTLVKEAE